MDSGSLPIVSDSGKERRTILGLGLGLLVPFLIAAVLLWRSWIRQSRVELESGMENVVFDDLIRPEQKRNTNERLALVRSTSPTPTYTSQDM